MNSGQHYQIDYPLALSALSTALRGGAPKKHGYFNLPSGSTFGSSLSDAASAINQQIDKLQIKPSPASLKAASPASTNIEEKLFDATSNAKVLTSHIAMHLNPKVRDKLFAQIDDLHSIDEWEHDDLPLQKQSFATFLKAILHVRPERLPSLGLTHTGVLIAAWTTSKDSLTIEFLPKDHVRWVLSKHVDDEIERYAGHTPVTKLADGLAPYNPDHWFSTQVRHESA